jgi:cobalt-precorrin-5B (C1)-methyltransferase
VDFEWLAALCPELPRANVLAANSALAVLEMAAGTGLVQRVAEAGLATVRAALGGAPVAADVIIVSRQGEIIAHAG